MAVYMNMCVSVYHRGHGSHRLLQLHIDLSLLIGWCKCLSTILSPLLLTRLIAVISTSSCLPPLSNWVYVFVCVTLVLRSTNPFYALTVSTILYLFPYSLSSSFCFPVVFPLFLLLLLLLYLLYLFSSLLHLLSRLFRPYLNWAGAREQSILTDPCRCILCVWVVGIFKSLKVSEG